MTKENPTLSYFEKLVDKFKQVATHKGYEGTPTMERIDQTLQGIKEKVQSLVGMVSTKVSSPPAAKKDPAHFQNLVGGKTKEPQTFVEKTAKNTNPADTIKR
jgi:hypothetical protein